MLTLITCPTCHHKFTVPEGNMGQRSTCPNCQSIFVAGKSVAESDGRVNGARLGLLERAAAEAQVATLPLDKTMLGETEAPIHYNCPRCKAPLEAPASEAGTKLRDCLARLEDKNRQGIILAFVHGLSHPELAARLGQPQGSGKSWIRRGLLTLRECLA